MARQFSEIHWIKIPMRVHTSVINQFLYEIWFHTLCVSVQFNWIKCLVLFFAIEHLTAIRINWYWLIEHSLFYTCMHGVCVCVWLAPIKRWFFVVLGKSLPWMHTVSNAADTLNHKSSIDKKSRVASSVRDKLSEAYTTEVLSETAMHVHFWWLFQLTQWLVSFFPTFWYLTFYIRVAPSISSEWFFAQPPRALLFVLLSLCELSNFPIRILAHVLNTLSISAISFQRER